MQQHQACDVCGAMGCSLIRGCTHGLCTSSGQTCITCAAEHECQHSVDSFSQWAYLLLEADRVSTVPEAGDMDQVGDYRFAKLAFSDFGLLYRITDNRVYVALECRKARTCQEWLPSSSGQLQPGHFQRTLTFNDCHVSFIQLERSLPDALKKKFMKAIDSVKQELQSMNNAKRELVGRFVVRCGTHQMENKRGQVHPLEGLEERRQAVCGDLLMHNEFSAFCQRIQNKFQFLFEATHPEARDVLQKQKIGLATRFADWPHCLGRVLHVSIWEGYDGHAFTESIPVEDRLGGWVSLPYSVWSRALPSAGTSSINCSETPAASLPQGNPAPPTAPVPHCQGDLHAAAYHLQLGVPHNASLAQISHAYRHMALTYHPDKRAGTAEAHEDFAKLGIAFQEMKVRALSRGL